jgi:DNA-binding CsgD family transcriptional regulator
MMPREASVGFEDLLVQLKISNRLLAAQLKGRMKQNELIALLATTGATAKEIGEVFDTTAATVQTTLTRMRKKSSRTSDYFPVR